MSQQGGRGGGVKALGTSSQVLQFVFFEVIPKSRYFNELSSPLERDKGPFKLYLHVRSMAPSTMSRAQQLLTGLQASGDESRLVFLCLSLSIHDRC